MRPTQTQLKQWLTDPKPFSDLRAQLVASPTTPHLLEVLRREVPDVATLPVLTYTSYREFERTGFRGGYQDPWFLKRAQLARAVIEYIMGDATMFDIIQDRLWSICEETTWVFPAHEEQGPNYWEIFDRIPPRTEPFGASTMLTREPESIDLFCAETGAVLAETIYLIGDELAPEVRQRVRQEVQRRIFRPYLAYGRDHWWFQGELNWNGVCNGSIGMAFLRLERDLPTLIEALSMVLEGFETYIARGFEADGGSIEGVGYWNYGLLYYVTVAELLREMTGGEFDLLAQSRLVEIAQYPPGMALVAPGRFINFGDALEHQPIRPSLASKLAERTGVDQLRALITPLDDNFKLGMNPINKLVITVRDAVWWDCTQPLPEHEQRNFVLPEVGVVKMVGQLSGQPVILVAKSGHTDGHHSHVDIGNLIINIAGESLIPDAGRGLYSKEYFRKPRYDNIFNNSYGHSVPRIGGQLQAPGPEFEGTQQYFGTIAEHGAKDDAQQAVIDFHQAYAIPELVFLRRTVQLDPDSGAMMLRDEFEFDEGKELLVEEAFVTWFPVEVAGSTATIKGERSSLKLTVAEPDGVEFAAETLEEACRENQLDGTLTRLTLNVPGAAKCVKIIMVPTVE